MPERAKKKRAIEARFNRPVILKAEKYTLKNRDGLRNFLPQSTFRAVQYCLADLLSLEGVPESGIAGAASFDLGDEISDLVYKCVFVADLQAGHPPLAHIGHVTVGAVDLMPAAYE